MSQAVAEVDQYLEFIHSKAVVAEKFGTDTSTMLFSDMLFPHQVDLVRFALEGGRRAIFASFGLGKTFVQLEIAKQLITLFGKPFLIVCPLGVSGEFKRDNLKLNTGLSIEYITDTDDFSGKSQIYLTNYERIRKGDISPDYFCGVSFDEASILRNLQTDTTNFVLKYFKTLEYRFVATATPTPNDFIEILNYADYLGVISRGHALTRFFQRDSQKAGNLKLYENKKDEFWQWVSTWAAFVSKPSDLGYDDAGYDLPDIEIIEHRIRYELKDQPRNKRGDAILFKDLSKSLVEVSKEKRDSMDARVEEAIRIVSTIEGNVIMWHHREAERVLLEQHLEGQNYASVYGSQPVGVKEDLLIGFSEGKFKYLLTKPVIAGSGCNFQDHCSDMVFVGIDYKFNDFIQAIHRIYRFGQKNKVRIHIIRTENEDDVYAVLQDKWAKHLELNEHMIELVRNNGLNSEIIKSQMIRQVFKDGRKIVYDEAVLYNNDNVVVLNDHSELPDNSVDLGLTSIPFGDHYEYSDNYNDFGHNHGNINFFKQMDFLTPNLLRVLKPGRVFAVHVKDRIRYSYQNGTSFTTISDFSGDTVAHFIKHGFYLMGKITVTTDVVAENNQTYRLGWTEQCKDASKMGVGLPEYILLFRKAPTVMDNSYADTPVVKDKNDYTKAQWQLDAHSYQRSSGDRFMSTEELRKLGVDKIVKAWKKLNTSEIYDFMEHISIAEQLDKVNKLSSTFMTLPVHSNNDMVWTDVNRMNTLNTNQANSKKEKHICPLQFDIIERLINRYSMEGEVVFDPFAGLFSTTYKAIQMKRRSIGIELNPEYFIDGNYYVKTLLAKMKVPTLFDLMSA